MATATDPKDLCIRINQDVFQDGRTELLDDLVTDDFVNHAAPPHARNGRAALAGTVDWLQGVFSGAQYEIHRTVAEGDLVALHLTMRARHTGDLFGHPPTGRPVEQAQMHFFRVEGDRVAEHWAVRDDAALMRQLTTA
jgi:predicted ester cyclase